MEIDNARKCPRVLWTREHVCICDDAAAALCARGSPSMTAGGRPPPRKTRTVATAEKRRSVLGRPMSCVELKKIGRRSRQRTSDRISSNAGAVEGRTGPGLRDSPAAQIRLKKRRWPSADDPGTNHPHQSRPTTSTGTRSNVDREARGEDRRLIISI